jgi:hypothetical protein
MPNQGPALALVIHPPEVWSHLRLPGFQLCLSVFLCRRVHGLDPTAYPCSNVLPATSRAQLGKEVSPTLTNNLQRIEYFVVRPKYLDVCTALLVGKSLSGFTLETAGDLGLLSWTPSWFVRYLLCSQTDPPSAVATTDPTPRPIYSAARCPGGAPYRSGAETVPV